MRVSKEKFFGYLFVITIFTKLTGIEVPGVGAVDLYAYPVLFLFVLLYPLRVNTFLWYVFGFGLFSALSVLLKIWLGYPTLPLFKQLIPAFIIYLATISYLSRANLKNLFGYYGNVAFILAFFGIVQVLLYFVGISISNHPRFVVNIAGIGMMRLSSLLPEPSHFSIVITPAFIYFFFSAGIRSLRFIIVASALLLTFSATAFVAIGLTFSIHYLRRFNAYSILGMVVLFVAAYLGYTQIEPIRYRIDETIKYSRIEDFTNATNTTTFSVVSNFNVALYSLDQNWLMGVGLGGHEESYKRYFSTVDYSDFEELYLRKGGLNETSAHSLLIRLISEVGILGLLLAFWFIRRYRLKKETNELYYISLACLSYFIARCFKLGGYFDFGIYFFLIAYYRAYVEKRYE